jgi:hypothetical protein
MFRMNSLALNRTKWLVINRVLAGRKRQAVQAFGVTQKQEEVFKDNFFQALVTSCIAFNFVENEYLYKAFASLGMSPMTRKDVSGRRLRDLTAKDKLDMQTN